MILVLQLNAVYYYRYLEWVPYEKFQNITHISRKGFSQVYLALWPNRNIEYWDIEKRKWHRKSGIYITLKVSNDSDIDNFLNKVNTYRCLIN